MAEYISDFDLYRGTGKVILALIFIFFGLHVLLFMWSLTCRDSRQNRQPGGSIFDSIFKRLKKIIEKEVMPTLVILVIVIMARGITVESAVVVVVLFLGYVALLVGEFTARPDLKIIGRVGYGMATLTLGALAVMFYNYVEADVNG